MTLDAYVRTTNGDHEVKESVEVAEGVVVDYDADQHVVGVLVSDAVDVRSALRLPGVGLPRPRPWR